MSTYKNTRTHIYEHCHINLKHEDTQDEEGCANHNLNASSNSTTFRFLSVYCVAAADRSGENNRLHLTPLNM